jgi:hypothetical protein
MKTRYSITDFKKPEWMAVKVINHAIGFDGITSKKNNQNKHRSFVISERFTTLYEILQRKTERDEAAHIAFIEEAEHERLEAEAYIQMCSKLLDDGLDEIIEVESDLGSYFTSRREYEGKSK